MAAKTRHLSLLVPGLLGPVDLIDPGQLPTVESLSLLLRRGKCQSSPYTSLDALLFSLLGIEGEALSVASLAYLYDGETVQQEWCMRADPVFMLPGQSSLMVMASGEALQLNTQEASELETTLNRHFEEQGLRFHAAHPHRWYCFSERRGVSTTSLSEVQGKPVQAFLPQGEDGVFWNGILAEAQMLLFQHPLNMERQASGRPQVNSLWFWGEGEFRGNLSPDWDGAWGNNATLRGWARLASVAARPRPRSAREWLTDADEGRHLVVLDQLASALPDLPQAAWQEFMEAMEVHWFAPLLQAMKRGELASLSLYPLDGHAYSLNRSGLRHWWQRPRPLTSYLQSSDYG